LLLALVVTIKQQHNFKKTTQTLLIEIGSMSERKPPYGKQIRSRNLPKVPAPPEEPLRGLEPGKLICTICGKMFKTKNGLERHRETMHGAPERPI
jgi:hypothetical protein